MKRTIVPGGILALSLAVVLLAATASSASAAPSLAMWKCPPPSTPLTTVEQIPEGCLGNDGGAGDSFSFGFGYHRLGTSASQRFALGGSSYTFTPSISVSGDYTQTNNCPPTLSAGAFPRIRGCIIEVTFAPTDEGPRGGTLSTGPGGPELALGGAGYRGGSFDDPRGDQICERGREGYGPKPCSDSNKRSADIVRATARHEGTRLRHTIRVVGKFQSGWLTINTDSDERCEWDVALGRLGRAPGRHVEFPKLRDCGRDAADRPSPGRGGRARVEFHRHSVEVVFRESQIGNPEGYGWHVSVAALGPPDRGLSEDSVPDLSPGYPYSAYVFYELG